MNSKSRRFLSRLFWAPTELLGGQPASADDHLRVLNRNHFGVSDSAAACARRYVRTVLPLEEYARELSRLDLANKRFNAILYAEAVQRELGANIKLRTYNERDPDTRQQGWVEYDTTRGEVHVYVPRRVSWWLQEYTLYHELGHIVAGHHLPIRDGKGNIVDFKAPQRRLAQRPPLDDAAAPDISNDLRLHVYEEEAELRAKRSVLAAALGRRIFELDRLSQAR